jgi:hypothetical protein
LSSHHYFAFTSVSTNLLLSKNLTYYFYTESHNVFLPSIFLPKLFLDSSIHLVQPIVIKMQICKPTLIKFLSPIHWPSLEQSSLKGNSHLLPTFYPFFVLRGRSSYDAQADPLLLALVHFQTAGATSTHHHTQLFFF